MTFETDPEGIVEIADIKEYDGYYKIKIRSLEPGTTLGTLIYTLDKDNPGHFQQFNRTVYTVTKHGIILTDNYGFGGNGITFMALSNFRLITKEGFRPVNLLGIFIGGFMIAGALLCFWLLDESPYLVDHGVRGLIVYILKTAVASAFIYFECILFATVVCLQRAGTYKPKFDKDFIIILGCAIKKDGTLYPLLRGRVDRAIEFYRAQLKETGKKAVFVPSGGQGSDEVISEGEAMKRYLIEQGIEEEQIMPETRSTTTLENMKFSYELIKERDPDASVAFSTTNYHVFRGGMFAREAGMDASGMGSKTKWFFWPNAEVREFIGLVVNRIWVHVAVVIGLAALSVLMANLGKIIELIM